MNRGWKNRIHERVYVENKKEQREAKQHFVKALRHQMEEEYKEYLEEMTETNATH
jgi:dihydroorotate dehydrogenase